LTLLALAGVVACSSCGVRSEADLRFVTELRNRYPRLSVAVADDGELLEAGRALCAGRSVEVLVQLVDLGVDRNVLIEAATDTICPAR
jgi:hypothetical protein